MSIDPDILKEFLWSTHEDLEQLDEHLREMSDQAIGGGVKDSELINAVYRHFHSLKGSAGLVGLELLESTGHRCEELLSTTRNDTGLISVAFVQLLQSVLENLKWYVVELEKLGHEPVGVFDQLLQQLEEFSFDATAPSGAEAASSDAAPQPESETGKTPATAERAASGPNAHSSDAPESAGFTQLVKQAEIGPFGSGPVVVKNDATPPASTAAPADALAPQAAAPSASAAQPAAAVPDVSQTSPAFESSGSRPGTSAMQVTGAKDGEAKGESVPVETTVRVDIKLLDQLMNLVGELVLTRNQMVQQVARTEDSILQSGSQALDQVTSDLQEKIMQTRMQPIGNIFNKFPRVVRDLSRQLDKKVDLQISGKDTELDRTILEAMRDPFTHILRNSIDHGIESPAKRLERSKKEMGTVHINAFHEGGQVIVEVADDGGGIDPERVKAKAISKGLISQAQADVMSHQEAINLITTPGLSTAESITNISGRGVGMDVVRSNIEKIGGSLEIDSEYGRGSTIRIKIPLTLAIIPALMVGAGGHLFGIPQINLVELVGIEVDELNSKIEHVRGAEVYRLRERLLTLVRPHKVLNLPDQGSGEADPSMVFIVVVAAGDQQFGVLVDDIYDTEEIVVKSLSSHLNQIEHFAGATIRGDGRVCLILDMTGFSRACRLEEPVREEEDGQDEFLHDDADNEFLVFDIGGEEQFAIPLQLVARIEQYLPSEISRVNGNRVICHESKLVPIIELDQCTDAEKGPIGEEDPIFAIVINHHLNVALVAHHLVDSMTIDVSAVLDDRDLLRSRAVTGLVVVEGKATALLDAYHLIDLVFPHQLDEAQPIVEVATGEERQPRILYAEDGSFFRKVVDGYLSEIGYDMDIVNHGQEAWEKLQAGEQYDLVLTDLEMPIMDGWDLIKNIRSMPAYDHLPVVALTSLDDEAVKQKTLRFGANAFAVKIDRDQLTALVTEQIQSNKQGVSS